jgi:hypothetical protein
MKKMNVATAAAIGAGLLALAGCNRSTPEQPSVADNGVVPETNVTTASNTVAPVTKAPSASSNASEAVARPEPPAPDSQTQDDADATGMTARVHRDDAPANETTAP